MYDIIINRLNQHYESIRFLSQYSEYSAIKKMIDNHHMNARILFSCILHSS